MNKRARNVWVAIAGLVALFAALALLHRLGSRSALERYKATLLAQGEKLTTVELALPLSPNAEEIAARDLFATNLMPSNDLVLSSLMDFVGPGKARVASRGVLYWDVGFYGKTNGQMIGDWAEYDRTNALIAPFIGKFREALNHPPPDAGILYADTWASATNFPRTAVWQRRVAFGLVHDEIAELHQGHFDAAIADLHALAGLARMYRNDLPLVTQMIRVAIARLGVKATWEALQVPGWDERSLKMIQEDWERVNLIDAVERGLEGNRAFGQLVFREVRERKGAQCWNVFYSYTSSSANVATNNNFWINLWKNQFLVSAYKLTSMNEDELLRLKHESEFIDAFRMLKTNRPASEVQAVTANLVKELDQKFKNDRFHRCIVSAITIPNFTRAVETAAQGETERRMAITALAIKRYELRHGSAPQNLAALTPIFLAAVPIDPMIGKPLCYRLNPDRTFTLYSVGTDGKDDGGNGGTDMWGGADAVWPSAARPEEDQIFQKAALKN